MASAAIKEGKRDLSVASAAELPLKYFVHGDRVCAGFRDENRRVAIVTIEPLGMGKVRKNDIVQREPAVDFKNDIQVKRGRYRGFNFRVERFFRADRALLKRGHPVDVTGRRIGKVF